MDWEHLSRSDVLNAYTAATKTAYQLESDLDGTLVLLSGEVPCPGDFPWSQFKCGWIWCRFYFYDLISDKKEEILLPGCDMASVRPPESANELERVKYPQIIRNGANVFWPSPDKKSLLEHLDNTTEELRSKIAKLEALRREICSPGDTK